MALMVTGKISMDGYTMSEGKEYKIPAINVIPTASEEKNWPSRKKRNPPKNNCYQPIIFNSLCSICCISRDGFNGSWWEPWSTASPHLLKKEIFSKIVFYQKKEKEKIWPFEFFLILTLRILFLQSFPLKIEILIISLCISLREGKPRLLQRCTIQSNRDVGFVRDVKIHYLATNSCTFLLVSLGFHRHVGFVRDLKIICFGNKQQYFFVGKYNDMFVPFGFVLAVESPTLLGY